MKPTNFAKHLSPYLTEYLPRQRNASANTVKSYRDTFSLFLKYFETTLGIAPEKLTLERCCPDSILGFLEYLETVRNCKSRTRNQRLAAIHAFFRYVQSEAPDQIERCQQIMAIPFHRFERKSVPYLTVKQLELFLKQPNCRHNEGMRHAVMLRTLYDTGARVQEMCDLVARDVRLDSPPSVTLTGKGRKTRITPLMSTTVEFLRGYMQQNELCSVVAETRPLFFNRLGQKLSRSGVSYLIAKYTNSARQCDPSFPSQVSPHTFRHTKAMHLLQSGNSLTVIQAILGHADIKTCGIYASADLEMKRKAMQQTDQTGPRQSAPTWQQDQSLLNWLKDL
ncbi:Tyrosine recombinase XerC [Stieleria bergensis]|uniref:Tyrosine recombinase XerC n=1 Tax=Stieleria bergensis TaxID=2528025 RepID=A0A517T209_9BACT|nr:Tyrosine recombinase XerC [Planctomycetes bacterium SV_7m_r]